MRKDKIFWALMKDTISFSDKLKLIHFILTSNRFTNGPKVVEFEKKWSAWLGVKHSLFVSSGSTANFLLIAAIKELYKPNESIRNAADDYIKTIGGPYKSIYIRRGDKTSGISKEMNAIEPETLIQNTGIKDGNVFVMSDDYNAVDEIKTLLPNCKIFTLTDPKKTGHSAERNRMETADIKKKNAEELFTSMEVFHRGEKGWADNRSNLGRILKLRGQERVALYPVDYNIPADKIVRLPHEELKGDPV
jgi:glycerophosphoryl diester phosphodiesterase